MAFYDDRILPHIIDRACSTGAVMKRRHQLVPQCYGEVLEVGIGSGINLPLYEPERVSFVYGLDPSHAMRRKARANLARSTVPVEWLEMPGETIPLPDAAVDSILLTFTLCSIGDWRQALSEMHRVLRKNGELFFCEHGQSPDAGVQKWQDRVTPAWKKIAGGCHLNRPIDRLLEEGGFIIDEIHTGYLEGAPRFASYIFQGKAHKSPARP